MCLRRVGFRLLSFRPPPARMVARLALHASDVYNRKRPATWQCSRHFVKPSARCEVERSLVTLLQTLQATLQHKSTSPSFPALQCTRQGKLSELLEGGGGPCSELEIFAV